MKSGKFVIAKFAINIIDAVVGMAHNKPGRREVTSCIRDCSERVADRIKRDAFTADFRGRQDFTELQTDGIDGRFLLTLSAHPTLAEFRDEENLRVLWIVMHWTFI